MKLTDYKFVAGKNGTSGLLDIKSEIEIKSKGELDDADVPYRFSGGSIMIPILLDLHAEASVEKIKVEFLDCSGGVERVDISVNDKSGEQYRKISSVKVENGVAFEENFETSRFIKLNIYKAQWTAVMPQITVFGSINGTSFGSMTEYEYKIEWMKLPAKVDKYGQYLYEDWSGKIYTDNDLVSRYNEEKEYLKNIDNSKYQHDEYGGIIDGNNYGGTGFFRTQKIDDKWWLITPIGNKYILKGTEAANLFNGPGLSRIYYKGTDIRRSVYTELPDKNQFPEVYCQFGEDKAESVSLLLTNIIKKYGKDNYLDIWRDVTMKRLKKWNFNAHAKWTKDSGIKLPYICSLGFNFAKYEIPRILYAVDPYDSDFEENVILSVKDRLLKMKDDRLLIGYHFTNESGWNSNIVKIILESDENTAAKRAFVKYISKKYNDVNALSEKFKVEISEAKDLEGISLSIEALTTEEIDEFIFLSSVKFHSIVQNIFKEFDPNHLYMGGGLPGSSWHNSIPWTKGSADYCDVITFDRYSKENTDYLKPYLHIDKPMANIEWSFITNQRGYSGGALGRVLCNNQSERADLYKEFVESHMKIPQIVGLGWFLHYDQPLTGRALNIDENAECYNFGLVDMQDTPYYEFVDKITLVNDEMEKMHEQGDNYTP